jgi:hypothetical protein
MKIMKDGKEIIPVSRMRVPATLNRAAGREIAHQGVYVYRNEDFGPRDDGSAANYTMQIGNGPAVEMSPKMISAIVQDFVAYLQGSRGGN